MYKDRVRRATYEELEEELLNPKLKVLNRPIKIPRFNMIENVNDVDFNDFDLDNRNIKTMLDKQTQKDYEIQNHDLFPEMYDEIDATGSVMGNHDASPKAHKLRDASPEARELRKLRDIRTQTKRFTPKGFDLYSSANSSSDKPSSPPSPHHISRPTSSESSEQEAPNKKGLGFFNSREWDMFNRLRTNENRNETTQQSSSSRSSGNSVSFTSSSGASSSSLPSNVHHLSPQELMRSRSHTSSERRSEDNRRSHTSSSGGSSGNKKSK